VQLTEVGWNDSLDWSPDGKHIVYAINKERIEVVDTDGTHRRELATGSNPRWSPDGRAIAFMRQDSMYRRSLYRISPDGSNLALIIQTSMNEFAWSPDGDRIAITRATGESVHADEIVIIPAQASKDEHIIVSDQLFVYHLTWSPDGKKFAFEGRASLSEHVALYVIDNDGIRLKRIADDTKGTPSWGPDSKRLLFIRERPDGNMGISFRNLNYGTVWDVDYEPSHEVAFSPDGETIALTHLTDIYLGHIDGRPLVNLTGPLASQFEHPCKP
jgi:Tol biopolymer transport system component